MHDSPVRRHVAAASGRIARLRRMDRAAVFVITLGGIAVVAAVFGILIFVAMQALPLFQAATVTPAGDARLTTQVTGSNAAPLRGAGVDEYQLYFYVVEPTGTVAFYRTRSGERALDAPIPGLGEARVVSSSRALSGHFLAAGLSDGRAALMQVRFVPQYEGDALRDLSLEVRDRGAVVVDPASRPLREISYLDSGDRQFVAALVANDEVAYWWARGEGAERVEHRATLRVPPPKRVTHVRVGLNGAVLAGTEQGLVYHWAFDAGEQPRQTDVSSVSASPVTAIEWMVGGTSWVGGTADGTVSGWFRAPVGSNGTQAMVQAQHFERQRAPIAAMAVSPRDRSFATVGADGEIVLRHQTSERVLARLEVSGQPGMALIAPKADGLLTLQDGVLRRFALHNPHPETSWKVLFGRVWYEGYPAPAYVWQSTGATSDFEPKLSLVPLIFGTIKGTCYAMMFAVPLAVLAALYTSQFTEPRVRAAVKPAVEIMAALPSVVIGFLAGLYLTGVVERYLVPVMLMIPLLPLCGTAGVLFWHRLPARLSRVLRSGTELLVMVPMLVAGGWLAVALGPWVERMLFAGDVRLWLQAAWGLTYDQRNCIVVGIAMGFAIIPIVFTIAEDAFSGVPSSLTAASLALGATRWQTALRVVLPTASPGVFSAIMIGFGRAVGETMIVLMAAGNTPLMDWSIFNGIRTLSANIAVEIAEAPQGGTLYRTLFLSAALLFLMTFVLNTIADVVRQRLRERYRAI